ncbi:MAG TPA: hypothetical protein VFW68_11675 [Rhodocyclaceae bacterium]|nr:hypothetical protein [Rhodocyclaceae bacterium]
MRLRVFVASAWRRRAAFLVLAAGLGLTTGATADGEALRSQVARPLQSIQELLKESKFVEALDRFKELDALQDRSDYENFVIERMRVVAALNSRSHAVATRSLVAVLEAKRLSPVEQAQMTEALVSTCFIAKDYACVEKWAQVYAQAGGVKAEVALRRAQAAYLSGAYLPAAQQTGRLIDGQIAAGGKPDMDLLQLQASAFLKGKDDVGYLAVLQKLVAYYPSPEYWSDLVYRMQRQPGFPRGLELDAYRLLFAVGGFTGADEYLDMSEAAIKAGYPAEAAKVLERGVAAGMFADAKDAVRHKEIQGRVAKLMADDLKAMAQTEAALSKAKDGNPFVSVGLNFVLNGQSAKGLDLMSRGIARGVGRQADEARLRLAFAYLQGGDKAKAVETFVSGFAPGAAADLARLWSIHLGRTS